MLIYMFKLKDVLSDFRRISYERVMESFYKTYLVSNSLHSVDLLMRKAIIIIIKNHFYCLAPRVIKLLLPNLGQLEY